MRIITLFNRLLAGKGFWVRSVRFEQGEIHVGIVSRRRVPRCGGCGRIARRVHDRKKRVWRHLAILAARTLIEADLRRVRCRRCGFELSKSLGPEPGPSSPATSRIRSLDSLESPTRRP